MSKYTYSYLVERRDQNKNNALEITGPFDLNKALDASSKLQTNGYLSKIIPIRKLK